MSVVTLADAWPKPGEPFTVSDLDRMPDDGHRYELLDGTLIVSPAPGACLSSGPHCLPECRRPHRTTERA